MNILKRPKELPEWFLISKEDTFFTSKDLAVLFGCHINTVRKLMEQSPFTDRTYSDRCSRTPAKYWAKQAVLVVWDGLKV